MANVLKRLATSVSVWVTLLSALIAVFIRFRLPFKPNNISLQQQQVCFHLTHPFLLLSQLISISLTQ
uniref:Uncharacterized protein n=1 Tax=Rhizophora mucronata TaxID=61149 RepID=A0A2P2KUQ1_RHIMU